MPCDRSAPTQNRLWSRTAALYAIGDSPGSVQRARVPPLIRRQDALEPAGVDLVTGLDRELVARRPVVNDHIACNRGQALWIRRHVDQQRSMPAGIGVRRVHGMIDNRPRRQPALSHASEYHSSRTARWRWRSGAVRSPRGIRRSVLQAALQRVRSSALGARQSRPAESASDDYSGFCQTEMWLRLELVKGSRFQSLHRSRRAIPARRAMRSNSDGHTLRNGAEKDVMSPSMNQ